jgi:hypothetical protein
MIPQIILNQPDEMISYCIVGKADYGVKYMFCNDVYFIRICILGPFDSLDCTIKVGPMKYPSYRVRIANFRAFYDHVL